MGDFDVAHGGERRQEVEALEDEAYFGATHFGALGVGEFGKVNAVDEDRAGGSAGKTAEDVEEGGLAGAGGADDGDELAGRDGEADLAECGDFEFAGAIGFAEVLGENDGRGCGGALVGLVLKRGNLRLHVVFQVYVNEAG